uniref:ABPBG25 n=1 Tax=Mus musculus castaneus TaxID=10091 RepID=A0A7H1MFN7_MUSMC|nr:ABPBG25 [Mus musculus castaneus]
MKRTLLLLVLLVTGELGFQRTEACHPFFSIYFAVLSGLKIIMYNKLLQFDVTAMELETFGKLQECYNEGRFETEFLNPSIMKAITIIPECREYYTSKDIRKIRLLFIKTWML